MTSDSIDDICCAVRATGTRIEMWLASAAVSVANATAPASNKATFAALTGGASPAETVAEMSPAVIAREDPIAAIQKLGGANQAIALAVSPKSFEQAYASLRRGGTLVFVALPADNEVTLPIFETVLNGITVVGSIVGTRKDLREVFALHAAGKTNVIRETRSLDDVNEAIADVEAGRVAARIVFGM